MFENIKVVKRDGKKVDFDGSKIALAIKKGFDSVALDEEEAKYSEKDINKVYNLVIEEIGNLGVERIKIEEIQDLIEKYLQQEGYEDVYTSFSEYRERRAQSRKIFFEEKKQHKFLKALEALTLKKENNEIERYCQKLDTDSKNYLKKIGLVRYNAYKDTGSNLSFALAILNEHNTGIVLNGIYGRDTSNIYAKPIVEGKCEYALSNEEKDALDKAIK